MNENVKYMECIQMNNATVETKNSVDKLNSRSDIAEEITGKNLEKLPERVSLSG